VPLTNLTNLTNQPKLCDRSVCLAHHLWHFLQQGFLKGKNMKKNRLNQLHFNLGRLALASALAAGVLGLSACAAAVGSPEWCAEMKAKPAADWTANQVLDYAKHCVLK
jgi:hypothetical protein